jgi:hypothetical protein
MKNIPNLSSVHMMKIPCGGCSTSDVVCEEGRAANSKNPPLPESRVSLRLACRCIRKYFSGIKNKSGTGGEL